jgi:hypothetical protein
MIIILIERKSKMTNNKNLINEIDCLLCNAFGLAFIASFVTLSVKSSLFIFEGCVKPYLKNKLKIK